MTSPFDRRQRRKRGLERFNPSFVLDRLNSVVFLGFMTSYDALASDLRLRVVDRVAPHFAIGHLRADVPGLIRGMNGMTRLATPALPLPVNVQIMQVAVAVAEVGQRRRKFIERDILVVAFEAESVFVGTVGRVKLSREIQLEDLRIFGAVGCVTGDAIPFPNRTVGAFAFGNFFAQALVTTETHFIERAAQELVIIGAVGRMAFRTLPFGHRGMGDRCRLDLLLNRIVAIDAQ